MQEWTKHSTLNSETHQDALRATLNYHHYNDRTKPAEVHNCTALIILCGTNQKRLYSAQEAQQNKTQRSRTAWLAKWPDLLAFLLGEAMLLTK